MVRPRKKTTTQQAALPAAAAAWCFLKVFCFLVAAATAAKSLQSCPTLCNPKDGSPPGSPVPGILQARTLEWVAISFSMNTLSNAICAKCSDEK